MSTQSLVKGFSLVLSGVLVGCTPAADEMPVSLNELDPVVVDYSPPVVSPESHDLTQEDIERLIEELSNWGRWGPADQIGAANLITPAISELVC